ncbi:aryl-sulfate sulfotransferase [Photobacterium minamisatsumaniensis]|uniref:aryl-sulfate sulfotransferase n=1 Tax=Photobacterium minamisatsumaniensis TaxID=2910233 RepID=UPI003D09AD40
MKKIVTITLVLLALVGCKGNEEAPPEIPEDLPKVDNPKEIQPEQPINQLLPSYTLNPILRTLNSQPVNRSEVFDVNFQQHVADEIDDILSHEHRFDSPLLIMDPFHTNTLSLYVAFFLPIEANVSYSINTQHSEPLSHSLTILPNGEEGMRTDHQFSLMGLVPGTNNTVRIHLSDENGAHVSEVTFSLYVSDELLTGFPTHLDRDFGEAQDRLSEGYTLLQGNNFVNNGFSFWLDNAGTVRGQVIGLSDMWSYIRRDGYAYYNPDNRRIVKQNLLTGQIEQSFEHSGFVQHHDHQLLPNGNLIVLVSNEDDSFVEDHIIEIDVSKNEVIKVMNLRDLLVDYPHSNNNNDWLHVNSLHYQPDDNGSLFISGREVSSIIKVANYHSEPFVDWMINHQGRIWQYSEHHNLLLQESGNTIATLGQHTVGVLPNNAKDDVNSGNYRLYSFNNMFANNNGGSNGHPVDYSDIESENSSYLSVYQIDETTRQYQQALAIEVTPKSQIRSSAQFYASNYLIGSLNIGMNVATWYGRIDEYTSDGRHVQSTHIPDASYRATKFPTLQ